VLVPERVRSARQQAVRGGLALERVRRVGGGQAPEVMEEQKVKLCLVRCVTTGPGGASTASCGSVVHGESPPPPSARRACRHRVARESPSTALQDLMRTKVASVQNTFPSHDGDFVIFVREIRASGKTVSGSPVHTSQEP
jgi:hypothetical protein